jgi:hypothetical protein
MNVLFSMEAIPKDGPAGTIKAPDWLPNATLGSLRASIAQKPG